MSLGLLARQPLTWDSEAASYITAVESADTTSLEPAIARAINQFVIDCKVRGIWGSIKASCLLCGPRTLNGALIPLKGIAPTNNNFVSSDYNRETGLKGNGSTKYLDSNRAGTSDPSDNSHCSVYVSSPGTGATAYIGQNGFTTGASSIGTDTGSNNYLFLSLKTSNGSLSGLATIVGVTSAVGLMGMSKNNNNNNFNYRFNSKTGIANIAATTVGSGNWEIFGRGGASRLPTNARLSFYSIGESLDLRLLEQCVENYNNSLSRIFTSSYIISDTDAATYIALVEAADKTSLSYSYRKGVNDFIAGCKSDNIWTSLKSSCILIGARTLSGILVPLVGTAPTNNGFGEVNYNRNLGLSNISRGGWLDSNRNNNADPQDDQHMSVYITDPESTTTEYQYIGVGTNITGSTHISTNLNRRNRNGSAVSASSLPLANTLLGMSRSSSSAFISRTNGSNTNHSVGSQSPYIGNIGVFSREVGNGKTNATLAFYSIGANLDLALLDNRVTTLINELSAARSL